ncbi:hypothetical protein T05_9821 [Trichinella murrelli]|uniref:Uncharacterized protein n=1 Tax=Trichinella murrelli TaxID=144512 RepID=A0A0V0SYM7_9BILA|nr:hypothetical protein T05_9821 [Trichinella murrelli]
MRDMLIYRAVSVLKIQAEIVTSIVNADLLQ